MTTRDIDTDDTGLPIPGREHDPPRSQALEEPAQKLPCEPSANPDGADDAGKLPAPVDLVERLESVYDGAYAAAHLQPHRLRGRAGIRAILAELAAIGAEALDVEAIAKEMLAECGMHAPMPLWDDLDASRKAAFLDMARGARNVIAPILAAKDARLDEQEWKDATRELPPTEGKVKP
jgi:hypothetical protein